MSLSVLSTGTPAPLFVGRTPGQPRFHFDLFAGRYTVLCFFGSAGDPVSRQVLDEVSRHRNRFDDVNLSFCGISIDPADENLGRVREMLPGIHLFWDFDFAISRMYKAMDPAPVDPAKGAFCRRFSLILDERLRAYAVVPFESDAAAHVRRVFDHLAQLPATPPSRPAEPQAPVLVTPRVFEPEFCRTLIQYYDARGGTDSGFMQEIDGKTVGVYNYDFKRRRDEVINDETIRQSCMARLYHRLIPEIHKAFQFRATRIERYIVACYDATTGGHFGPHRDNTTKGTAHRRFAVSLNLNTGDYEGGCLRFPEFGRQTYAPPAGGAVVFSCSLLHEATPVTSGKRYAFLPFLYDEEAARIRQENMTSFDPSPERSDTLTAG
jgi:predicted 2-oxoglutarate/Fe(II)-dependent dioxygenase YbiX/peroxiredoxin